jgi:hypothetical protein
MKFLAFCLSAGLASAFVPASLPRSYNRLFATIEKTSLVPPSLGEKDIQGLYNSNVQTTYG